MKCQKIKFKLVETILWEKKFKDTPLSQHGFFLLKYHIDRIKSSANYFNFKFDKNLLTKKLFNLTKKFNINKKYKVRVLLNKNGKINFQYQQLSNDTKPKKIILSPKKINNTNIFLYHKTTYRKIYTQEYKKYKKLGYYDVLFKNQFGQITEFSQGNIFLEKNKKLITPPTRCGLLNGVFRKYLLSKYKNIVIKPIYEKDLFNAQKIYLTNSVRKMVEVKF